MRKMEHQIVLNLLAMAFAVGISVYALYVYVTCKSETKKVEREYKKNWMFGVEKDINEDSSLSENNRIYLEHLKND